MMRVCVCVYYLVLSVVYYLSIIFFNNFYFLRFLFIQDIFRRVVRRRFDVTLLS
jgi:hypothetical protein